jgi:hypothetical protein
MAWNTMETCGVEFISKEIEGAQYGSENIDCRVGDNTGRRYEVGKFLR